MSKEFKTIEDWILHLQNVNTEKIYNRMDMAKMNILKEDDEVTDSSTYIKNLKEQEENIKKEFLLENDLRIFKMERLYAIDKIVYSKILELINDYQLDCYDFYLIHNILLFNPILKQQYKSNKPYKTDRYKNKIKTMFTKAIDYSDSFIKDLYHLSPSDNIHYLYHSLSEINYKNIDINELIEIVAIDNYKNEFERIKPSPNTKKIYKNFKNQIPTEYFDLKQGYGEFENLKYYIIEDNKNLNKS